MTTDPTYSMTTKDVAKKKGVSAKTVQRWRHLGLRASKVGRVVLFAESDVEAFLASKASTLPVGGSASPPTSPSRD